VKRDIEESISASAAAGGNVIVNGNQLKYRYVGIERRKPGIVSGDVIVAS